MTGLVDGGLVSRTENYFAERLRELENDVLQQGTLASAVRYLSWVKDLGPVPYNPSKVALVKALSIAVNDLEQNVLELKNRIPHLHRLDEIARLYKLEEQSADLAKKIKNC